MYLMLLLTVWLLVEILSKFVPGTNYFHLFLKKQSSYIVLISADHFLRNTSFGINIESVVQLVSEEI